MTDEAKSAKTIYEDVPGAPVVYFDIVAAHGVMNGAVQIELAQRILTPVVGTNDVIAKFAASGRLRCSPAAAQALIASLQNVANMLEQSSEPVAADASKLN